MQSTTRALLPACPPSLLTCLLSRKAADRSCHFATALCSTQLATESVPPWPLAALQPSLVTVLFLKHYIKITAERICLLNQLWDEKSFWCDTGRMIASRVCLTFGSSALWLPSWRSGYPKGSQDKGHHTSWESKKDSPIFTFLLWKTG